MNRRLCAALFLLGLPGLGALSLVGVPALASPQALPAPLWVLQLSSALQGGLLLLAAVLAGAHFAPRLGLDAPVVAACAQRRPAAGLLRAQLLPALLGGLLGGFVIASAGTIGPLALRSASDDLPLVVRLLYGGVTEELLLRWGLMTLLAAGFTRLASRLRVSPALGIRLAIVVSALVFGAAHLPSLMTKSAELTAATALFVVFANAAFGLVAGWLYWRRGLEAAILAHVVAHATSAVVIG